MKRRFGLCLPLVLAATIACLSCDQFGASASPSPSPSAAMNWTEVGVAGGQMMQNGWQNYGSGYQNCAYALDSQGLLHIVGLLEDSSPNNAGEVVFTLPDGFRPSVNQRAGITMLATGFMSPASGILTVLTNGNVVINPPDPTSNVLADIGQVVIKLR